MQCYQESPRYYKFDQKGKRSPRGVMKTHVMRYKNLNVRVRGKQVTVFNFRLYILMTYMFLISSVGRAVIRSLADCLA
jgi:hypothetical protein